MRSKFFQLLFLVLLTTPACKQAAEPPAPAAPLPAQTTTIPPSVSAQRRTPVVVAVHSVLPAVVNIQTEATLRQRDVDPWFGFFGPGREYTTQSLGSGFVWASDGIVVTNAHVVEGASRITVNFQDGSQLDAQVIGADPDNDLAVLRVPKKGLPAVPIGTSSDLLIGETVIAVGNPFGLSGTVTTGVVSAIGRSVPSKEQGRTFTDFIQTDASINPGNSGGPLLNIEGRVIGINTAIFAQAQGIGFAIPVDRARKIVEDLRRYGQVRQPWIGVITSTLTPEEAHRLDLSARQGALVTRIFGGSPADRAGIQPGDVIVAVGGTPIDSRDAYTTAVATAAPDVALNLEVQRGERRLRVEITPTTPPSDLGLQILQSVSGLEVTDGNRGIVISDVASGSRGARIGLRRGDAIVGINGHEVDSSKSLNDELMKAIDRASIVLYVARGRYIYTLTFPMAG